MRESAIELEISHPAKRLDESIGAVHDAVHAAMEDCTGAERLTYTFMGHDGILHQRELSWTPMVDETGDVARRPRLTITDGDETSSYLWVNKDTVLFFPPGQDDEPEVDGPNRLVEFADKMDTLKQSIELYPDCVDVYAQDAEASKISIVERIGQVAIAIHDKAWDWGMEHAEDGTLRMDRTDQDGVRHRWSVFFTAVHRDDGSTVLMPAFHAEDGEAEEGFQLLSGTELYHFTSDDPDGYAGDIAHMRRMKRRLDAFYAFMRQYPAALRLVKEPVTAKHAAEEV